NHLIYITFGEQNGSVYATQVKQLLNYWSLKIDWRVTLIQIADEENLKDLNPNVQKIYIKRKFKLLLLNHKKSYLKEINENLNLQLSDNIFFNSRGGSAYLVASSYIKTYNIAPVCNNLDVRGTIEE